MMTPKHIVIPTETPMARHEVMQTPQHLKPPSNTNEVDAIFGANYVEEQSNSTQKR